MTVDLIIPVYKPDNSFFTLLDRMLGQNVPVNKIIIMNVEQKFFDRLMYSSKLSGEQKHLEIHHISKREFDCGKTRNQAAKLSDADYIMFMDQYSMPINYDLISTLLKPFEKDEDVAVSYARQMPGEDSPEYVKFIMRYFFSPDSRVKSLKDVDSMGWSAYICSNSCAIYRRSVFEKLGGFLNHAVMGEDVLYASKAINESYKVSYTADAVVINDRSVYTRECEKKFFDLAVSMAKHPETYDLQGVKAEFRKLEKLTVNYLKHSGNRSELLECRHLGKLSKKGFKKGLSYRKYSYSERARMSANPDYWRADELLRDRSGVDARSGYGRSDEELKMLSKPPVKARDNEEA